MRDVRNKSLVDFWVVTPGVFGENWRIPFLQTAIFPLSWCSAALPKPCWEELIQWNHLENSLLFQDSGWLLGSKRNKSMHLGEVGFFFSEIFQIFTINGGAEDTRENCPKSSVPEHTKNRDLSKKNERKRKHFGVCDGFPGEGAGTHQRSGLSALLSMLNCSISGPTWATNLASFSAVSMVLASTARNKTFC